MDTLRGRVDAYALYLLIEGASAFFFELYGTIATVYRVEWAHLDPLQLVLVGTALESASFLFQIPTGTFADVYSRKCAVIVGFVLIGAGFVVEGLFPLFGPILLAQGIWGTGYTFTDGAQQAWIADEIGDARAGQAYLRGAQAAQLGAMLGALASVALASARLNLPILVGGGCYVVFAMFLIFCMPERRVAAVGHDGGQSWGEMGALLRRSGHLLRERPALLTILGIGAIAGMASEGFDRLGEAHFLLDVGLPPLARFQPVVWFGVMAVGSMLLSIAATEWVRRRTDTTSYRAVAWMLFAINTLLVASVIAFGLAGNFVLVLGTFWCVTLLRKTNTPLYTAWLNQGLDPRVRATVLSMAGLADSLGQIVGGPIIGAIGTAVSIRAAIVTTGAALSPALALFARAFRQGRASAPLPPQTEVDAEARVGPTP